MTSRAIITILSLSAVVLMTLAIWPKSEAVEDDADLVKADQFVLDFEPTKSIVQPGDSLFAWNDSTMFFDFIKTMDSSDIVEHPANINKRQKYTEPVQLSWSQLQDIHYGRSFFESIGMEVYVPLFSSQLLELEGRNVVIEGYVIPIDGSQESLALSASPFAACFFCGKGSPASVVSLYFDGPKKTYVIDDFVQFEGRLRLNADNPEEFYYYLEQTSEMSQED